MEGRHQNVPVARHEADIDKIGEDDVESAAVYRCEIQITHSMDKRLNNVKEWLQYIGIVCIALFSGLFLVIKMAITEAKEETRDIERASKLNK